MGDKLLLVRGGGALQWNADRDLAPADTPWWGLREAKLGRCQSERSPGAAESVSQGKAPLSAEQPYQLG